jgi:hypothetical protein|tara:strand:+ start:257 stop:493 length:237 start_codon:yes stop_codon:yes gene_type:complete
MSILSFILGLLLGVTSSVIYFWKKFSTVNDLLHDKMFINDLLKKQVKDLQKKKAGGNNSRKYSRRKSYNKKASNIVKQ